MEELKEKLLKRDITELERFRIERMSYEELYKEYILIKYLYRKEQISF